MKKKKVNYKVVKPSISDAKEIQALINFHASKGDMLPRSLNMIYENLRDFFVVKVKDKIVGCGSIHIDWIDLAEIKSVAVHPDYQGTGVGKAIVQACLKDAEKLGLKRVFALTYKPDFFKKYGFEVIDKNDLPHKVWSECINCPKFPDCNEIAVIIYIDK